MNNKKIIIAVTGASGSIYAKQLLSDVLNNSNDDISIIFSETGKKVWLYELNEPIPVANHRISIFENDDLFAPPSSGSSHYDFMIVIPCSMGTLARITHGISHDLICRSADVILKEQKKLILVPREFPYNLIHLTNMQQLAQAGGIILPASPSFYSNPVSISDLIKTVTHRILSMIDIKTDFFEWGKNNTGIC